MPDFVNPTTLATRRSEGALAAPWLVIARDASQVATVERKWPANERASTTEGAGKLIYTTDIEAVPQKYRKWVTDHVEEMTAGEKATVDAAEADADLAALVTRFDLNAPRGVFRAIIKPATTTRSATTTLADDPHLKFAVVAGAKYIFQFRVFFDTTAAADFKLGLNGPSSPTGVRFRRFAIAPGGTAMSAIGVSTAYNGGTAITGTGTTGGYAECYGILFNGANAGDVAFAWAQNTSDAGNTSVLEGSMLHYARIG